MKEKFPDGEIHVLLGRQLLTTSEKVIDNLPVLTVAPFGIPDIINSVKNTDKEYFLIHTEDSRIFVTVTDEFLESRRLSRRITEKKFQIGGFLFTDCGVMKK